MAHSIKMSEAFQLVDKGAPYLQKKTHKGKRGADRSDKSDDEKLDKGKD